VYGGFGVWDDLGNYMNFKMSCRLIMSLWSWARPKQAVFTQIWICGKFSNSFGLMLFDSKM